jgi:hypothetical protein
MMSHTQYTTVSATEVPRRNTRAVADVNPGYIALGTIQDAVEEPLTNGYAGGC